MPHSLQAFLDDFEDLFVGLNVSAGVVLGPCDDTLKRGGSECVADALVGCYRDGLVGGRREVVGSDDGEVGGVC